MRRTSFNVERGDSGGRVNRDESDLVGRRGEDAGRHITANVDLHRHLRVKESYQVPVGRHTLVLSKYD